MATKSNPSSKQSSKETKTAGTDERVIKKYPNRRLYDTQTSNYITLSDIKQLVMTGTAFKVRDAKTDEDLTRSMLLQIILDEEAGGTPIFSETILANLIRTYGHAMQGFMGSYLEKNLQAFADMQTQLATKPINQGMKPEAWAQQLASMQTPFVQMQAQVQEQMQEQMLALFGLKKP